MNILRYAMLLPALLLSVSAMAQDLSPSKNEKGKWGYVDAQGKVVIDYKYNQAFEFADGRAKVEKDGKYGYINTAGKEVIKIKYTAMYPWENRACKVAVGGSLKDGELEDAKWGYIDENGSEFIKPQYSELSQWDEQGRCRACLNGKWGFLSVNGSVLLKPEYDKIGSFDADGLAYVVKGGKYGYISRSLQFVIQPKYSAIGSFNNRGYCWVAVGGKLTKNVINGAKFGICDRNGDVVIKPNYKHIGTFTVDIFENNPIFARVVNSEQGRDRFKEIYKEATKGAASKGFMAGLIGSTSDINDFNEEMEKKYVAATQKFMDAAASFITEQEQQILLESPRWNLLGHTFVSGKLFTSLDMSHSDLIAVSNSAVVADESTPWMMATRSSDKVGIVSLDGKVLVKPGAYEIAFLPSEGLIPVAKSVMKGMEINYQDYSGKLLFKNWIKAVALTPFTSGVAIVAGVDGQYLIDRTGNRTSQEYRLILPQVNESHVVMSYSGFGIINRQGRETVAASWDIIHPESEGLYCARNKKSEGYGFIDAEGTFVVQPGYADARSFSGGSACVKTDSGWGVIDATGSSLVECLWDDALSVAPEAPGLCWVKKDELWRTVKVGSGETLFEGDYATATNFGPDGLAVVESPEKLFGCVDLEGNIVIPMRLSSASMVPDCLSYMKESALTKLSELETRNYNVMHHPLRNGCRLTSIIDNSMWDY